MYTKKIAEMTTEQKLGMLYCARRFEEEDMEFIIEMVKKRALGCVQAYPQRPEILKRILDAADYPILIICDTERGFPTSELPKTPLISLAACNKKEYYRSFAKGIVRDAKAAGYNGTWGPVIDVLLCDGPGKVSRYFSDNPYKVGEAAEEIASIFKQNNYLSCGKHYPGGDNCPYDSHMVECFNESTEQDLLNCDVIPYMYLHKKGLLPSIMTTHSVFPNIDPEYPASLSKKVIDIIRNLGFDGVAFTDSLAMMGILQKYGEENVYGIAVAAGNDIILPNYRTPARKAFEMLVKNYHDGVFSEERLNEAVRRVLVVQEFVGEKPENPTVFTEEDEKNISSVARDCITAITDDGISPAIDGNSKDRLFIILEKNQSSDGVQEEMTVEPWYDSKRVATKIMDEFPESGIEFLPEFSTARDNERVLTRATKYKEVVFVTFCTSECYLGTDCLTRRAEMVINCLIHSKKVSTVVHFGNPFALKPLLHVPRKIFGYSISDSQVYAIDVLAGKLEPNGRLPFDINFQ